MCNCMKNTKCTYLWIVRLVGKPRGAYPSKTIPFGLPQFSCVVFCTFSNMLFSLGVPCALVATSEITTTSCARAFFAHSSFWVNRNACSPPAPRRR